MCLSSLQFSVEVEVQLKKQCIRVNPVKWTWKVLITLTLLHRKDALSYEKDYGSSSSSSGPLSDRTPPDKNSNHRSLKIKTYS